MHERACGGEYMCMLGRAQESTCASDDGRENTCEGYLSREGMKSLGKEEFSLLVFYFFHVFSSLFLSSFPLITLVDG